LKNKYFYTEMKDRACVKIEKIKKSVF